MRSARWVGCLFLLTAAVARADFVASPPADLPSSDLLAQWLWPYLLRPLPATETITGVTMPRRAPLMVVASLGDDEAVADLDRGYAVGFTLNELLFDADPQLDVLAPHYYAYDTRQRDAPTGAKRDSTANAYRAGVRNDARWCVHGRISGVAPTKVHLEVDGCSAGNASHPKQWAVKTDADWPATLAEMCEFAAASATGNLTPRARASCERARDIHPASLLALARYGGPKEKRAWTTLEAMQQKDPGFAPVAVEYLSRLYYNGNHQAFADRVGAVADAVPRSSAVQLVAHSRVMKANGWTIKMGVYPRYYVWLRSHAYLSSAWLVLASALAGGAPTDWPNVKYITDWPQKAINAFTFFDRSDYPPNEGTHSASLALALAIYRNAPDSYRSLWIMGYALERYGLMIRGWNPWQDVPEVGQRGFPVFIRWADKFDKATLRLHPDADIVWTNHMVATALNGGDWVPIFEQAVEIGPHNPWIYDTAMNYALPQWGGDEELRQRIAAEALARNPDAQWAKTLPTRVHPGLFGWGKLDPTE